MPPRRLESPGPRRGSCPPGRVSARERHSGSGMYVPALTRSCICPGRSDSTVYVPGRRTLIRRVRLPMPDYISITLKHYTSSRKQAVSRPIRPIRPLQPACPLAPPSPSDLQPTNKTRQPPSMKPSLARSTHVSPSCLPPPPRPLQQPPSLRRLARRTAYMLAPHLAPINNHHAAAPPPLVPALAAPAAVPPPVPRLVRARRQRALGHRHGADVRRRRVRDRPGHRVGARLPLRGPRTPAPVRLGARGRRR